MKTFKISSSQLSAFVTFLIVTPISGISLLNIINYASVDAYLSVIFMAILGLIPIGIIIYISNYNHNLNIIDVNKNIFGKTIGSIINYLLFIIILIISLCVTFSMDNLIVSQFLSETPLLIVSLFFNLITIYNLSKGFQSMSRVCFILLFINLSLVILGFLGLFPTFELSNVKPFLEHGIKNPFLGSLSLLSTNILPVFLVLVIPKNNIIDKENYTKNLLKYYFIAILVILSIVLMTIGNLGIYLSKLFQYPEYFVLKKISFLGFIDRIENIVTIKWIFSRFSSYSIMLYFLSKVINNSNDDKVNIKLLLIISILSSIATVIIFNKGMWFNNFSYYIYPYITGSLIIFYILIFIFVYIKKKKS